MVTILITIRNKKDIAFITSSIYIKYNIFNNLLIWIKLIFLLVTF
jgi:hypothetical protein